MICGQNVTSCEDTKSIDNIFLMEQIVKTKEEENLYDLVNEAALGLFPLGQGSLDQALKNSLFNSTNVCRVI